MNSILIASLVALSWAPPTTTDSGTSRRFGGFVDLNWRLLGLANHVSHGPGFAAGAILFRYFEVGIAGFSRPGPINPKTFTLDLPDGETYRGKSSLQLRSDGTVVGVLVGARFDLRRVPLSFEIPVTVGYAGFGFYLHGEDRKTPDGRRVSEWEDELLAGRDSDPANLAIDVGARVAWRIRAQPHIRLYFGASYTAVPGFSTPMATSYSGFSGVLGVQFGLFSENR